MLLHNFKQFQVQIGGRGSISRLFEIKRVKCFVNKKRSGYNSDGSDNPSDGIMMKTKGLSYPVVIYPVKTDFRYS